MYCQSLIVHSAKVARALQRLPTSNMKENCLIIRLACSIFTSQNKMPLYPAEELVKFLQIRQKLCCFLMTLKKVYIRKQRQ